MRQVVFHVLDTGIEMHAISDAINEAAWAPTPSSIPWSLGLLLPH
jgi:hypothetical protein